MLAPPRTRDITQRGRFAPEAPSVREAGLGCRWKHRRRRCHRRRKTFGRWTRRPGTAQAKKQAAPAAVFPFAAARSTTVPLEGTTYPATAEMPKKTQPRRLTAG